MNYLDEMSSNDIHTSFSGTFVGAYINNTLRSVYITEVNGENLDVEVGGELLSVHTSALELTQPDLGMFYYNGRLLYVARKAERQWRRGLRSRTLKVMELRGDGDVQDVPVSHDLGTAIARHFIEQSPAHQQCLSRDMGVVEGLVFLRNVPVGRKEGNVITMFGGMPVMPPIEGIEYVYCE